MQLRRAGASAEGRQLVVDLTDVPFMDATGLAALIEVQALISGGLTIRNPPWSLTRILVALNLTGLFEHRGDPTQRVAAHAARRTQDSVTAVGGGRARDAGSG